MGSTDAAANGSPDQDTLQPFVAPEGLFSPHWLINVLPESAQWDEIDDLAERVYETVGELLERQDSFDDLTEHALRNDVIGPILDELGHDHQVEVRTPAGDFLDYVLFESEEVKIEAEGELSESRDRYFALASGILEAKAWDTTLDSGGTHRAGEGLDPSHPAGQLYGYMLRTEQRWGILTNGRKWRIYHYDGDWPRIGRYFEIDLPALYARGDLSAFKYFVYFFSGAAFQTDAAGRTRLDHAREGTIEYRKALEDDLGDAVYRALRILANGFVNHPDNDLDPTESEDRQAIHDGAMKLLYRLLFVFKAEAAGLLPLGNRTYREQRSLHSLKRTIAERIVDPGDVILNDSTEYDEYLDHLFRLVDEGSQAFYQGDDDPLGIPPYNGGLFHREDPVTGETDFLTEHTIGDADLAEAVDLLARGTESLETGSPDDLGFVDYTTLEAQQLGTLYEGLLMYQLDVAEGEDHVAAGEDQEWIPVSEHDGAEITDEDRIAPEGTLYLRTDKGERHATGSYYTPDFIVRYIVDKTLTPVVERKLEQAREENRSRADAVLSTTVLDPAMGSGHFLVGAIDFLTPHLLDAYEEDREQGIIPEDHEVSTEEARREIAAHCIYGVDKNQMAVELAKVTIWLHTLARGKPLTFLDHRLRVGDSLLGADIRKLSHYPTEERRGQWADEVEALRTERPERRMESLTGFPPLFLDRIVGRLERLDELEDDTIETVKEKEEIYGELRASDEFQKLKAICDTWLAAYFDEHATRDGGEEGATKNYSELQWALHETGDEEEWERKAKRADVDGARSVSEDRRFFHWEIEFPEVFFEGGALKDEAGFDTVLGNPPYLSIETLHDATPDLLPLYEERYAAAGHGKYDIYVVFIEQGLDLLRQEGQFGYIVPNKWFKGEFGRPLRNITSRRNLVREIVDWRNYYNLFPGAITFVSLVFLSREDKETFRYVEFPGLEPTDSPEEAEELLRQSRELESGEEGGIIAGDIPVDRLSGDPWSFAVGHAQDLMEKLEEFPEFGSVANVFVGAQPGAVPIFILKEARFSADGSTVRAWSKALEDFVEIEADAVRPVHNGRDLKRWRRIYDEDVVVWPYQTVEGDDGEKVELVPSEEMESRFPKAWEYLNQPQTREKLESRESGKFEGRDDWYAFSYPRSMTAFDQPKVMFPDAASQGDAAWDPEGYTFTHTVYAVLPREGSDWSPFALQALVNTTPLTFWVRHKSNALKDRYFRFQTKYVESFPVPDIDWDTPDDRRAELRDEADEHLHRVEGGAGDGDVLAWVDERLDQGERDVVHDLLADCAEKINQLHEDNFQERKDLLRWLEDTYIKPESRIGDFAGKTKLREYQDESLDKILSILRKNKEHLTADPTSRDFHDRIEEEFRESVQVQRERKGRADRLVDLVPEIVYRLYGLEEKDRQVLRETEEAILYR